MIGTSTPCGRYLTGLPARRCEGVRFAYRTSSYRDGGRVQYVASRKCLSCDEASRVDVTYEVPRVIKTPEAWAAWWARIDARPW